MRNTYVGIIRNDRWDAKTLVLAESAAAARLQVLNNWSDRLGNTFQAEDLTIIPFGEMD